MAEKVVNRRLNIYIDQATAEQSLERLVKKEKELITAIEKQTKAGKDAAAEMKKLADTQSRIGDIKQVIDGKALPSIRMAEAAVQKLNRELKQLPASGEAAANKLQELRKAEATLEAVRQKALGVNTALNGMKGSGLSSLLDTAKGVFIGGGLLGIAEGALSGVKDFFAGAVDEALQAEEATARFKAQLDNLGRGDVFERLSSAADDFAKSVGYLDNDDVIGVFEKLIDYGKLTETQIKQLTPVIIDFAAKNRIDLSTAADVITKALEGNGKALKSFGIDIKDAKDSAETFGIIMTQLKPKVEGAAAAFGETTSGQIAKTRQEIKDLQEEIGTNTLPLLKSFYQAISNIVSGIKDVFSGVEGTRAFKEFKANQEKERREILQNYNNFTDQQKIAIIEKQRQDNRELLRAFRNASGEVKEIYRKRLGEDVAYLAELTRLLKNQVDTTTIGINAPAAGDDDKKKAEEEKRKREAERRREKAKKDREEAIKDFSDVKKQVEDATAPILSAYRKVNEEADDRIRKIKKALSLGLITPAEAQEALDGVERVLNQQRDELNKKFKLTSGLLDNIPGLTDMDAAMEADIKENGKAMGIVVANAIKKGVEDTLKEDDPIKAWLQDPETQKNIDDIFYLTGQFVDLFAAIGEARSNADRAAFEQEVENNDKRRESTKKLLDQKLISQQEYDRRMANIDKQQDQRQKELAKRQFERDKNARTANALMQGAAAQLETLSRFGAPIPPNFLGIAASALTLALTAANVIAIRSAKPPQFEKGGFIPSGSSHAQGGISLVDNRTGARVGEVEGGEPILSRKTYARNKPLIDSLLAASQSGTGMMNVPRLIQARQTVFENGGFIPKAGEAQDNGLLTAVNTLNQILASGINAKVLFGEYEDKATRISNIRNQSIVS